MLTARQYGEVVLPDASTGQGLGTLARKLSRCKEGMACFLQSWYKFYCVLARSRYNFDGSREFIPGKKLVESTGAVSRYKLSRSQKFITVQDLNYVQMRVSGCMNHYKSVLGAGAKAKSVTNNLPILSVLCGRSNYFLVRQRICLLIFCLAIRWR